MGVKSTILVCDNVRIHHYSELNFECFVLLYLPPYTHFLNPIENCFSKWKNSVIRSNSRNEGELRLAIESKFSEITPEDCVS
jgi:transposase